MDSEYLLLFYAIAIGAVILACYKSVRSEDRTRRMKPPEIPARLDPYELAYLRGGETEVTRIAIISMLQRGLLQITKSRDWSSKALAILKEFDRGRKPEPGELSPIEACIMKWTGFPALRRQIYEPGGIPDQLRGRFARTKAGDPDDQEAMPESSAYSDRLLMDGIFGVVSPADTPLTDLEMAMFPNGKFLGEEDTTVESAAAIWERGKIGRSGKGLPAR